MQLHSVETDDFRILLNIPLDFSVLIRFSFFIFLFFFYKKHLLQKVVWYNLYELKTKDEQVIICKVSM